MARDFDRTSSQYLEASTGDINLPVTIAAWFNPASFYQQYIAIVAIQDKTDATFFHGWGLGTKSGNVVAWAQDGAFREVVVSVSASINTWAHACGVFVSTSERHAYYNGGNKATSFLASEELTINTITIAGEYYNQALTNYFDGKIAEVGIWNVALTDEEVASLARGYSPLMIRPNGLVSYAPLIRDDNKDLISGVSFTTVNSPTISEHARVLYPRK